MNKLGKTIYAIQENQTILNISPMNLNVKCDTINTYEDLMELI